jgi:HlyD family secretion protein
MSERRACGPGVRSNLFSLGACGLVAISAALLAAGARPAQDEPKVSDQPRATADAKPVGEANPPTARVSKGPLRLELELKGVFQSDKTHELSFDPKSWTQPLKIVKVVPHGARVKKGDVLLEIDTEKLDRAIDDQKTDLHLAELTLELARRELPILEQLLPLELGDAERSKRIADEDLQRYLEIDRPLSEESARFGLRSSEEYEKYAREELRQLEKMYKDKDLTEETEEMILQRQRFQVESAAFRTRTSRLQTEQTLAVELPRRDEQTKEAATKATIAFERARKTLPLQLDQKRVALEKSARAREEAARKLDELTADREALTFKAPADGLVYYGRETDGQWSTSNVAGKMFPGGTLSAPEAVLTVVEPDTLSVRAKIEEKDLYKAREGLKGYVIPAGYPDVRLPTTLASFVLAPKGSSFDATVEIKRGGDAPTLTPGMTCSVKLLVENKDDALLVPSSAVFRDDDDGTAYVYRSTGASKPEKRPVKVGCSADGKTEITGGLSEGDEVLTSRP